MTSDKTILLVEDNPDDVVLTERALRRNNMLNELRVARDGAEAIAFLDDETEPLPTVVLLDLKLPKIGGDEVLEHIRATERTRRIPVVILTSSREEEDLIRSYNHGANSYIRKPVDFSEFVDAVRQLGMYWLLLNEPAPQAPSGERVDRVPVSS